MLGTGPGQSQSMHQTRCELPTAVHIAQFDSSDEDYLDFEEADDFEMENEANQASAAGLPSRPNQ